jgi:hypothetical protein
MNGHDPYAYLKDALTRLPTLKNNRIAENCASSEGSRRIGFTFCPAGAYM